MAEFKYTIEGVYETDKGTGKEFTNFNFEIVLSRFYPDGAGSHILRRFLPTLIRKQKNKPLFSGVRSFVITNIEKVSDEFPLKGKEISQMNEDEIQQLACMYDIFDIPLPSTMSITELREKAMIAYMKKVLAIPMKTPEEQAKLDFFKRQPDGTFKLDLGDEKLFVEVVDDYIAKKNEVKKKSLSDFIGGASQHHSNDTIQTKGEFFDESPVNLFPTANDLQNV